MSIRFAVVVVGVCAGISARASSVFNPGDVFRYDVPASFCSRFVPYTSVFPAEAQSTEPGSLATAASYLTSYTPPSEIAIISSAVVVSSRSSAGEQAREHANRTTTYYYGIPQPLDLALFNGYVYCPATIRGNSRDNLTKLVRIDLTTDTQAGREWGQRFWGLTVANGKVLACIYKDFSSPVWDSANTGKLPDPESNYAETISVSLAASEPSILLLIATGLLMISVRAIGRR